MAASVTIVEKIGAGGSENDKTSTIGPSHGTRPSNPTANGSDGASSNPPTAVRVSDVRVSHVRVAEGNSADGVNHTMATAKARPQTRPPPKMRPIRTDAPSA